MTRTYGISFDAHVGCNIKLASTASTDASTASATVEMWCTDAFVIHYARVACLFVFRTLLGILSLSLSTSRIACLCLSTKNYLINLCQVLCVCVCMWKHCNVGRSVRNKLFWRMQFRVMHSRCQRQTQQQNIHSSHQTSSIWNLVHNQRLTTETAPN